MSGTTTHERDKVEIIILCFSSKVEQPAREGLHPSR